MSTPDPKEKVTRRLSSILKFKPKRVEMSNFAEVIREQVVAQKQTRRAKKLLEVIDGPKGKRRDRILNRLERHARVHLEGEGIAVGDDWSTVKEKDWKTFFEGLLKFLMAILPMILPLFL